ncbi:predicted protein [Lichtheimia corymbifera JMRC:FSU:9682]|uniref:Uncharacterized protein n=1 Tax=Lichtheimia corymbifera JMRC:FSU:9682 TaxID=1263082 RepID=A0A068RLC5_9FUNG|nr:predicted protein [Lichtheimia corymbifera JMRC:FSU:9682]
MQPIISKGQSLKFGCFNVYILDTGFQVKLHDTPRCIVDDDALQEDAGTWKGAPIFDHKAFDIGIALHATPHCAWKIVTRD